MSANGNSVAQFAPWGALAVTLLVWLLNRSTIRSDRRDEKALVLEANYLSAHQQMLAEQSRLLQAEKSEHASLKTRFSALQSEHLTLQSAANEVILKYNLVRNLNPGDARFPAIDVLPPVRPPSSPGAAVNPLSASNHIPPEAGSPP